MEAQVLDTKSYSDVEAVVKLLVGHTALEDAADFLVRIQP